MLKKWS